MQMMEQKVLVHHFLHSRSYGKVTAVRVDDQRIHLHLPDLGGYECEYLIKMDVRDLRIMFVFDGDVPNGGIRKSAAVVWREVVDDLFIPISNVRKQKYGEENPSFHIEGDNAVLQLKRNFLLLPGGRSIVRLYRDKSLSPRYLIIEVDKKSGIDRINVSTTDY